MRGFAKTYIVSRADESLFNVQVLQNACSVPHMFCYRSWLSKAQECTEMTGKTLAPVMTVMTVW